MGTLRAPYKEIDLTKTEEKLRAAFSRNLYLFEAAFYAAVGLLLSVAAAVALFDAGATLWRGIASRTLSNYGLLMLDQLLLVLMLVEILHTVRISIFSKEFILVKPFLVVGMIASIRRVLVITMQAAKLGENDTGATQTGIAFSNAMIELGLLGVMILILALSIYLLNRSPRGDDVQ
jgi:phosphate-starvation-inducible protein E